MEPDITTETSIEELMAEVKRLREEVAAKADSGTDDSLLRGLQEFRSQNELGDGGVMAGRCKVCNQTWRDSLGNVRAEHGGGELGMQGRRGWHSFRTYDLISIPPVKGKYEAPLSTPKPINPEEVYLTEKDTALALGISLAEVRKLIKAKTIDADKFGTVSLIRRESMNRIIALKEVAEAAGIE